MCGIAGIMTSAPARPDPRTIARLGEALIHRGPDGMREYAVGNVSMVHDRLAIIDLATGDQPLFEPEGAALVANGEIYNYVELRAGLEAAGAGRFATASDCEPPLHLYRREGLAFLDRLRGMYALALHDPKANLLVLARDPFGIKPLYYVELPDGIAFASEAQALLAAGLAGTAIEPAPRLELIQLQFTTGRQTIFSRIQRLLPGEAIVVADGRIVERRRRPALPTQPPADWSEEEALARLDSALADSVAVHQRSDVPYGMFLSGGIDSAALLTVMARLNPRPVRAYTCGFPGSGVPDERDGARATAAKLGAEHVEVAFTAEDCWALLPAIAAAMDDPAADYACLPTYKLAQHARADGLKVVLCGEGGDELFAGYGRFRSVLKPWWLGGRVMRRRGTLDGLGVLRDAGAHWRDGIEAAEATARLPAYSRLQAAQAVDCADWLPNDLLAKLDRCLMAHGVEGRTPFLDPAVAAVAFRLPDHLKIRDGRGKWLLRRWLDRNLPGADAFGAKRGFTVPVGEWIAAAGARLAPLVAADPGVEEIGVPSAVQALFRTSGKRQGHAAWTLLFYALWHRRHVRGLKPEGDVFACLAAKA